MKGRLEKVSKQRLQNFDNLCSKLCFPQLKSFVRAVSLIMLSF